jgi:hypothetical protein
MLLKLSISLQENIYSADAIHDDCRMMIKIFLLYRPVGWHYILQNFMNGPNKLECFIILRSKGLPVANTPSY